MPRPPADGPWRRGRAFHDASPGLRALGTVDREGTALVGDWAFGLHAWGDDVLLAASLAAAERVLPLFEAARPDDERPRRAIDAARAYEACPCRRHGTRAVEACRDAYAAARDIARKDTMPGEGPPAYDAACAANQVAKLAQVQSLSRGKRVPARDVEGLLKIHALVCSRAIRYAAGASSARVVRAAIRTAIGGLPQPPARRRARSSQKER